MKIFRMLTLVTLLGLVGGPLAFAEPQLIIHNAKIVTVDKDFSIHQAMAVTDGRISAIGTDAQVLQLAGNQTQKIDLNGKTVIPGLIDSHVHSTSAAMTEFDHPIPVMETIQDVLDYIADRTTKVAEGEWIMLRQVFITRLREQRYPTREELDRVAPKNPVLFSTGPDASVNTLALKLSGIDKDFEVTDGSGGFVEKDPKTGEPTGILRSCTKFLKYQSSSRSPSFDEQVQWLRKLVADYNSVGLTGVIDRNASPSAMKLYQALKETDTLTIRVAASRGVGTVGAIEAVVDRVRAVAKEPLCQGDAHLKIIGVKTFLDGGMLTGSAYMRQPWGISSIYSITDPEYRGTLMITPDRLLPIVRAAAESGLQFTAHSVGDGAVHNLLDAYEKLSKEMSLGDIRPCITHSNFMSAEAVEQAARLGVVLDIQPAWLYLDTRTLVDHFGYDRLSYFQPLASIFRAGGIVGGGSDHMQKIGSLRSVNPYNPFLAMWVTITRQARWYDGQLHPEQALTREQALRMYTINNAYLMFLENETGSLEKGKRADFAVLDTDLLTCPVDDIKDTTVLQTYLEGKKVYEKAND